MRSSRSASRRSRASDPASRPVAVRNTPAISSDLNARHPQLPGAPPDPNALSPDKRVLFLTKDPALIRAQLAGEADLTMDDVGVDELLDDINTDAMTPAWVCFRLRTADSARDAYAVVIVDV